MWVFLTFVAKLLVLNNVCNDVEPPNFYVCREKTDQCHTPCWWLEKCGVVDYSAWVIYSSHVGLFHSSIQIRCLWKPKHIWYDEEVLSYSKHAETMRKIWANHQRISKILTIHFQTHAWVVRIPIIVFERFICESFIVFWHALWLWGLYPYLNQITSYELNVTCFWKIWSRSMVLTIQYINCVIYSSYVGLSNICIQITGLESHAQWCWAT